MSAARQTTAWLLEALCRLLPTDATGCPLPSTLRHGLDLSAGARLLVPGAGPAMVTPSRSISGYGTLEGQPVFAYHHQGQVRLALVLTYPTAPSSLRLPLRVDHPGWLHRTGQVLVHTDVHGATVIRLSCALAVDADGQPVATSTRLETAGLTIDVAHHGSAHPVVLYNIGTDRHGLDDAKGAGDE